MSRATLVLALMALGCTENGINSIKDDVTDPSTGKAPDIAVSPGTVDFGSVSASQGLSEFALVTIANIGDDDLTITGVSLDLDGTPFELGSPGSVLLPPGGATEIPVTFAPFSDEPSSAVLYVDSNDPDTPTAVVDLLGIGTAPRIAVSPEKYDFGEVLVGCDNELTVTVENIGSEELVVDGVSFVDAPDEMTLGVADLPWALLPGTSQQFTVNYGPFDTLPDGSLVEISSNDPDRPQVMSSLTGSATPAPSADDHFIQGGIFDQIDVLITVSEYFTCPSSMEEEMAELLASAEAVLDTLNDSGVDFQIMVVTNTNGCHNGDIITPDTPDQLARFQDALYGHTLSPDALLIATKGMEMTAAGMCNEGFLREDSLTSIISVADTDDTSNDTVENYAMDMQAMAPNLVYNSVSGPPPSACSPYAWPGIRFEQVSNLLYGRQESICDANWTDHLVSLVLDAADGTSVPELGSFELSEDPVEETIVVLVDSVENHNWTYNPATNSVDFAAGQWPAKLATVDISYDVQATCEG
jgi:hypothetical protein